MSSNTDTSTNKNAGSSAADKNTKDASDSFFSATSNIFDMPIKGFSYLVSQIGEALKINYNDPAIFTLFKYGFILASIVALIVFFAVTNESTSYSNENIYFFMTPLLLLFLFNMVLLFTNEPSTNQLYNMYALGFGVAFLILCIYFYASNNQYGNLVFSYISGILLFLIIVGSLATLFYFVGKYLQRIEGVSGFIIHLIFYIPCLLLQFIGYLKKEFNDTTNDVFYLFLFMVIAVLSYLFLPKVVQYFSTRNAVILQPKTTFINTENVVAGSEEWMQRDTAGKRQYNQNFSLSCWVYLNNQPTNYSSYAEETTIIEFAEGAPKVTYEYAKNENDENDKLNIYFTNHEEYYNESITLPIKKQKWNHLVFNYNSQYADVFLNGKLERTLNLANKPPQFDASQFLVTGANNGLDGAISNITYYPHPLTKTEIVTLYNTYSIRNPPDYIQ